MPSKPGNYDIGFGKPPRGTQFRKGLSGNPSGRPKGSRNLKTIVAKYFNQKMEISTGGKTRRLPVIDILMMRLRKHALEGDWKAMQQILALYQTYVEFQEVPTDPVQLHARDQQVLSNLMKRLQGIEMQASETGPEETE